MPNFHPTFARLNDYAIGELPLGPSLAVAAHVERCPTCQGKLSALDDHWFTEAKLFPDEPIAQRVLPGLLARVGDRPVDDHSSASIGGVRLPLVLADRPFERPFSFAPGYWIAWLDRRQDNWRSFLLKAPAGASLPRHAHLGREVVYVIEGSFSHGEDWYRAGDYVESDQSHEHRLTISDSGPCVSFIATEGPLQWKTLLGKFLRLAHKV